MVHSNLDENLRCISQTAKDTRCKNNAQIGSEYCDRHSPEQAELRSEAAKRAAATRKMGNLTLSQEAAQIKLQLRILIEQLRGGDLSPGVGAVVTQAWNTVLRAIELERKVTEVEEILPMLQEWDEEKRNKTSKGTGSVRW